MKNDKKGVFGLNSVKAFFVIILGIALLGYIVIVIMGTLQDTNVLSAGSLAKNQSNLVLQNVSQGVVDFFGNISSAWVVLAVLVIILVLVVLVRVVGGGPQSEGGL